jgi:hypothetical protein
VRTILRIRHDLMWPGPQGEDRFPRRCTLDWQIERARLFRTYTLASLRRQNTSGWEVWLLSDSTNESLHKMVGIGTGDPRVRIEYHPNERAREIQEDVFLMRIDSDDILAPDAIETLLGYAQTCSSRPYIQLDTGVAWDERTSTMYNWTNPSPPFYGRIVKKEELVGGLPGLGHHVKVRENGECLVIKTDNPMFCVVMHGGNISNNTDRKWCHSPITGYERTIFMERFGLK